MKSIITIFSVFLISASFFAQSPSKMSYQAVIRNNINALLTNQSVGMRISILQGSASGSSVYVETQTPTANANGLVSIEIGGGTIVSGNFSSIDWANGSYFVKTETDPSGGSNYTIMGISQLLSVPYALYAEKSGTPGPKGDKGDAGNGYQNGTATNQISYWNGSAWVVLNPGTNGQSLTICDGTLRWTSGGICPGTISSLNCGNATNNGTLYKASMAVGVNIIIPYTGGDGGPYTAQSINSTGVTGLTASLIAGNFANGNGNLIINISGTPTDTGTATFSLSIVGQNCSLTINVAEDPIVSIFNQSLTYGSVSDVDGNIYRTIEIGTQTWMAENLRTTKYSDGTTIPLITDNAQWAYNATNNAKLPMMSWYNNDQITYIVNKQGGLYNWYSVSSTTNGNKNVCPTGWHVPSDTEWNSLIGYLDPAFDPNSTYIQSTIAGGKMKGTGIQYWYDPNDNATNESGFTALPGGQCNYIGTFNNIRDAAYLWSSTEIDADNAWSRILYSHSAIAHRYSSNSVVAFSVRCLKD